jgi:hypothetical protein
MKYFQLNHVFPTIVGQLYGLIYQLVGSAFRNPRSPTPFDELMEPSRPIARTYVRRDPPKACSSLNPVLPERETSGPECLV